MVMNPKTEGSVWKTRLIIFAIAVLIWSNPHILISEKHSDWVRGIKVGSCTWITWSGTVKMHHRVSKRNQNEKWCHGYMMF
jgi:hypothetical protein